MIKRLYSLIDKERNIYETAELYPQKRRAVRSYLSTLQDPETGEELKLVDDTLKGKHTFKITDNVADFTLVDHNSAEWEKLNKQFLNYHKSLTSYTLINSVPIINYIALHSEIGYTQNAKVLDIGGGTGHVHASFFQYPETIEYFLLDPNLRLLHDQFIRLYPKLSYLEMAHILAYAENLPIKNESFDMVINLSSIDHMNDYEKFISEAYRVLVPGGKFLVSSHLDVPPSDDDRTKTSSKLFSGNFFERLSRFLYYRKHKVGNDDHTLHLEDEKPIEKALIKTGFKIKKQHVFKRYFYFVAEK